MNNLFIREIKENEYNLLEDFLYEAIFIRNGEEKPSRDIIKSDALMIYIKDFGKHKSDNCLVLEYSGKIIGACWCRIMDDYGHIDDETPSLAISLYEEYRNKGFGTKLLLSMLDLLKEKGYKGVSLSVQKDNYALKMYKKAGFKIFLEKADEYIMLYRF